MSGRPTFTGLLPAYPTPRRVTSSLQGVISCFFGSPVQVSSLGPAGKTIEGRYVVKDIASRECVFLKVFPEEISALQRHSAKVARYLASKGIPVIVAFDDMPRAIAPGYCGIVFPYVEARFSALTSTEIDALGRSLSRMHRALREYPEKNVVAVAGSKLTARLQRVAKSILLRHSMREEIRNISVAAARCILSERWNIFELPQMVHGDCNYTNVLFEVPSTHLRVIDFEESCAAWLNPIFDLGTILQRFVLMADGDQSEALALQLFSAYGAEGMTTDVFNLDRVLLELTYRSVLILQDKVDSGLEIPPTEWRKFQKLVRIANERADFLRKLSDLWSRASIE